MKRLFLLEDDLSLIGGLSFAVKKEGYEIDVARTTLEADTLWVNDKYDLAILDVSLPDGSGFDFCRKIRLTSKVPIIFLTAADEETDIIMGLDIGGDDYITKPFRVDELLARILAHLRREERKNNADNLKFDEELIIDYNSRQVFLGRQELDFSNKEFEIIRLLSQNAGMVFDRETIYERLWGYDGEGDSIVVKEHIRRIRNKLADYTDKNYIETVWGVGYKWIK